MEEQKNGHPMGTPLSTEPAQEFTVGAESTEDHSFSIQHMLGKEPPALFNRGLIVITFFLMGCVALTFVIQYPDIIEGKVVVTSEAPPVRLVANSSGILTEIFYHEGDVVPAKACIAQIGHPVNEGAIAFINTLGNRLIPLLDHQEPIDLAWLQTQGNVFGTGQTYYNSLVDNVKKLHRLENDRPYAFKIVELQQKIGYEAHLYHIAKEQSKIREPEIAGAHENYQADQRLFEEQVISRKDFLSRESEYFAKLNQLQDLRKGAVQNEISRVENQRQIDELTFSAKDDRQALIRSIEGDLQSLRNYVEDWKQNYQLISTESGKLTFLSPLKAGQYVEAGKPLFAVVDAQNKGFIGQAAVSSEGYGKVQIGQQVQVKLDNYPFREFGHLEGVVRHVSGIPEDNEYKVEVRLPDQLITSFGDTLAIQPEMTGRIEIITADLKLFDRIVNEITRATNR